MNIVGGGLFLPSVVFNLFSNILEVTDNEANYVYFSIVNILNIIGNAILNKWLF